MSEKDKKIAREEKKKFIGESRSLVEVQARVCSPATDGEGRLTVHRVSYRVD